MRVSCRKCMSFSQDNSTFVGVALTKSTESRPPSSFMGAAEERMRRASPDGWTEKNSPAAEQQKLACCLRRAKRSSAATSGNLLGWCGSDERRAEGLYEKRRETICSFLHFFDSDNVRAAAATRTGLW